ncbi:coiled-coil domain-containing protein 50 isoform X2 [Anabas testudineus]|uniref:coiled-coil domain-containing protein 50 isoform X2 n=1 Tax=Anabas testudineus TaxID=64144 RepID=UPI000E459F39|nr:coiled-coil domain-containing protein 50 isoform X2 [Anabas testudineus]
MAECNVSIDQKKLPGVKEVCRDFAVLEDHSLAYNLQEQEIESHLASNVHKSRLVQKDLQVAKKLQEEEDQRAKIQSQKRQEDIVRQDIEIAQEIQDQLVRQAEQQRQQEEKDAAIARKLQEKEMKEERRRQKQLEANFEEEYFEDHGASRKPLDLDKHIRHNSSTSYHHDSTDYSSLETKRSRYPKQDPAAPHSPSKYPEHYLVAEGGHSRHGDPYSEHLLPSTGKHRNRYPEYEPTEAGRARGLGGEDTDSVVRRKEKPTRPPPPQTITAKDTARDRDRDRQGDRDRGREMDWERHMAKDQKREREQDLRGEAARGRHRERSRDKTIIDDASTEREQQRHKDKDRQHARTRSKEKEIHEDYLEAGHSGDWQKVGMASWEVQEDDGERERRERRAKGRQRVHSDPNEESRSYKGTGDTREFWDPQQEEGPGKQRNNAYSNGETGHIVHKGSGALVADGESRLNEATKGLVKLDLREQELKDMEVARKLQEEEIKASKMHVRAAQVAQDEEIARLLMEQEKREYRKNRDREKEKERERLAMDKMAMEKRWQEGDNRPNSDEVVRPRTRDEYEYLRQKNHSKPARPAQPRAHDYENVSSGYSYPDQPAPSRPPSRPEAAYKGAYYKR